MTATIELWGERNGCYFPIKIFDVVALQVTGFGQNFMVRYTGQMDQLKEMPSACTVSTPHCDEPEQPANSLTGGKPALTTVEDEMTTVLFTIGQS